MDFRRYLNKIWLFNCQIPTSVLFALINLFHKVQFAVYIVDTYWKHLVLSCINKVINQQQSRIKCHAYDRDGAAFTFSQDLKIVLAQHSCFMILICVNKRTSCSTRRYWIEGGGDRVSVHFAVTYLDRWRTSFCVTTITKAVDLM